MKKIKVLLITIICILLTGCFGSNSMDNIEIQTTVYPIEYVTNRLYDNHSTISSIYPNGMNADEIVSDKLLKDYSATDLFIFNGKDTNESDYMYKMFNYNKKLKIIDATNNLPKSNYVEELWLDPMNLLTVANNIKKGFQEYTDTTYLLDEINKNYDELKIELIQLDADYRDMVKRASKKRIIVGSSLLSYLKKYDLEVISLEDNDELTQKTIQDAEDLVKSKEITTIYIPKGTKANKYVENLKKNYNVNVVELHTLYTLTEDDRKNNRNYVTIMYNNLELLKQQLYE